MPYLFQDHVYPDECELVEANGQHFLCYPRGYTEYTPAAAPRKVKGHEVSPYAPCAVIALVDDAAAATALSTSACPPRAMWFSKEPSIGVWLSMALLPSLETDSPPIR